MFCTIWLFLKSKTQEDHLHSFENFIYAAFVFYRKKNNYMIYAMKCSCCSIFYILINSVDISSSKLIYTEWHIFESYFLFIIQIHKYAKTYPPKKRVPEERKHPSPALATAVCVETQTNVVTT